MMIEPEHAPLAPSSAHVWGPDGCPGSVAMQAAQPPQEETDGIIWSPSYAKLPEELRQKYGGWKDYRIWWAIFVVSTLSIYGFFFWFQFLR